MFTETFYHLETLPLHAPTHTNRRAPDGLYALLVKIAACPITYWVVAGRYTYGIWGKEMYRRAALLLDLLRANGVPYQVKKSQGGIAVSFQL